MNAPPPATVAAGLTPPMPPRDAHPPWFRAVRPMRIAVLGWARLSLQAHEGSGYNLSASELAGGLAAAGHTVSYLSSGRRYGFLFRMRLRRSEAWRGVECWELVNAPNLSPALPNFRGVRGEIAAPRQTQRVLAWLDRVRAELVHVHSSEGLPLDLIGAIRDTARPVVVTPHNYWYACPQVDLLHREATVCLDYDGGRRCVGCLDAPHPAAARFGRRIEDTIRAVLGDAAAGFYLYTCRAIKRRLGLRLDGIDPNTLESPKPDPEAARGFDAGGPGAKSGRVDHGLTVTPAMVTDIGASPIDQNERFLGTPRDVHLRVLNEYGRRRVAGIAALNRASLVTPPSRFLLDAHVSMGVDPARGRVVRLGQPHFDQVHRRAVRSPCYDRTPWTPDAARACRFAFLGTVRANKGLEVLARAIPMLGDGVRTRCHFLIRASGGDWYYRKRLSTYPQVAFLGGYDLMQLLTMADEYDAGILPHIWFENSPLVLLEHLHAGKFVIASRLGGPPEWIVEPSTSGARETGVEPCGAPRRYNGLLFPAGDPAALADCITRVVRGEVALPSPSEVHAVTPLRSYPDHVREFDAIYRELLSPHAAADPGSAPCRADAQPPIVRARGGAAFDAAASP
ncbi:MAG: glycosyltransferase [Phycisphaerales bacterium]